MERNNEFNPNMNGFASGFSGAFSPYGYASYGNFEQMNFTDGKLDDYDFFNPMMQYEQAYMYYRCLSQQLDYKIKCKEYEKLCGNSKVSNTSSDNMRK